MSFLRSLAVAFSLFSRIPVPTVAWEARNMRYVAACMPIVGVPLGALVGAWCVALAHAHAAPALIALGPTLIPVVFSGGIHLDGFADVVDAQSSCADQKRKREILKDPHIGAFAAIGVAAYLVALFAISSQITFDARMGALLGLVYVISRAATGFAVIAFPRSPEQGMLALEQDFASAASKPALAALFAAAALAAVALSPIAGALAIAASLALLIRTRRLAQKGFGGMSGDIAGFHLCRCELACIACIAFCQLAGVA